MCFTQFRLKHGVPYSKPSSRAQVDFGGQERQADPGVPSVPGGDPEADPGVLILLHFNSCFFELMHVCYTHTGAPSFYIML